MSKRALLVVFCCVALVGAIIAGFFLRTRPPEKRTMIGYDTWIDIELPHAHRSLFNELERIITETDQRWNRYNPTSLVWQVNHSHDWIVLDRETYELFSLALHYQESTGGLFTVMIGTLVDGWNVLSENPVVPSPEEIVHLVELTAETEVELRGSDRAIRRKGAGTIDLGGIAKGYLVDLLAGFLRDHFVFPALINAGGTIYGLEREVRVGIPHPRKQELIGAVTIKNQAISTSGDYYRFFIEDGQRYHHIINPFDGYPHHDFSSVTVVAESATVSDVLSTAIMAGGFDAFRNLVETYPEAAFIAIDREGKLVTNQQGKKIFTPFPATQTRGEERGRDY